MTRTVGGCQYQFSLPWRASHTLWDSQGLCGGPSSRVPCVVLEGQQELKSHGTHTWDQLQTLHSPSACSEPHFRQSSAWQCFPFPLWEGQTKREHAGMWQVASIKNGKGKERFQLGILGRGWPASWRPKSTCAPLGVCLVCTRPPLTPSAPGQASGPLPPVQGPPADPAAPGTRTTYVKKGMGCTSFRSGSFALTVSACRFFRSPRASSTMACVSAALTDTSWIDMSLNHVRKTDITMLQTGAEAEILQTGMQLS